MALRRAALDRRKPTRPPQPAGDQRAAIALRASDRRTAISKIEQREAADEARAATAIRDDQAHCDIQRGGPVGLPAGSAAQKRPRICTEVVKHAAVSEKKIRAVAVIGNEDPDAYQRIVKASAPTAARMTPRLTLY